jgi:hypothetical protein
VQEVARIGLDLDDVSSLVRDLAEQGIAPLSGMTTHKQDKTLSELALALARAFPT